MLSERYTDSLGTEPVNYLIYQDINSILLYQLKCSKMYQSHIKHPKYSKGQNLWFILS